MAKAKDIINEDNILKILDEIYLKACDGIPKVNASVEEMADDYLAKHKDINKAAKSREIYNKEDKYRNKI